MVILYIPDIPIILPGPSAQNFETQIQIPLIPDILTIPSTLLSR